MPANPLVWTWPCGHPVSAWPLCAVCVLADHPELCARVLAYTSPQR